MVVMNFKLEFIVCKIELDVFIGMIENCELVCKNSVCCFYGNQFNVVFVYFCVEMLQDSVVCCELYVCIDMKYFFLGGDWLICVGFINGMLVKICVMKDCIVIML